jgi:hypothetical protein
LLQDRGRCGPDFEVEEKIMRNRVQKHAALAGVFAMTLAAASASAAPLPAGWTSIGNAGTNNAADGDVTLAPGFSTYQWISTNGGVDGVGRLPVGPTGQETDGSYAQTPTFAVNAGDKLNFYFNYITSDGDGYPEYAWAGLYSGAGAGTFDSYLFTARTTPVGNTVPGFGLPGLGAGVTLTPATTAIIAGGPDFSPLGGDSGDCWDDGCGYTGWIQMNYTFTAAGIYSLGFGVTNANDRAFDSAFAIAGVAINDTPIDQVPEPITLALFGLGLAGVGVARRRR